MTLTPTVPASLPEVDDPTRDVLISELDEHDLRVFEAGFLHGHTIGWSTRQPEIDALNREADRLYAEVCRRRPPRQPEDVTHAELCRRRGEYNRAERNERTLREWFPEPFGLTSRPAP
jgi:hypothetical protein